MNTRSHTRRASLAATLAAATAAAGPMFAPGAGAAAYAAGTPRIPPGFFLPPDLPHEQRIAVMRRWLGEWEGAMLAAPLA